MSDLEQQIGDMLADGRITDADADAVRQFADFLAVAGPPARKGEPIEIGPLDRLLAADRKDLIAYALGCEESDVDPWIAATMDGRRRAREWRGGSMVDLPEIRCERGCTAHCTKTAIVELFRDSPYHDYAPIPPDLWDVFFIQIWDTESRGDGDGYCPAADPVSNNIDEFRIWEYAETIVMLRCFNEMRHLHAPLFLDIGAHVGYYSVLAQRRHLDVRAIDADPDVCHGPLAANLDGVNPWNMRITPGSRLETAQTIAGRDLIVKIDIEGADADAVAALGDLWGSGLIRYAMIEISPTFGPGYDDLIIGLQRRGYRSFRMPPKADPPHPLDDIRHDLLGWEIKGSAERIRRFVSAWEGENVLFVHQSMDWPMFASSESPETVS